jgi:hypothetical protein
VQHGHGTRLNAAPVELFAKNEKTFSRQARKGRGGRFDIMLKARMWF